MRLHDDPLEAQFNRSLRAALDRTAAEPSATWATLASVGALGFTPTIGSGGLGLGPALTLAVCEELGARRLRTPFLDTAAVIDAIELAGTSPGRARLGALLDAQHRVALLRPEVEGEPTVVIRAGGWRVSGGAGRLVGDRDLDAVVAPITRGDRRYLCWLPVVRAGVSITTAGAQVHQVGLAAVAVTPGDRIVELTTGSIAEATLIARQRVRQASFLVGLARAALADSAISRAVHGAELAAIRLRVHHAAWLLDSAGAEAGRGAAEALALAAELVLAIRRTRSAEAVNAAQPARIAADDARASVDAIHLGTPRELWTELTERAPASEGHPGSGSADPDNGARVRATR